MSAIIYFKRPAGEKPVRDWLKAQDNSIKPNIYRKIDDLRNNGLDLLKTQVMDIISGPDHGFYELRNRGLGWRLAVFFDQKIDTFFLLHGWHKDNNYEREIKKARELLHKYLKYGNGV
jgi:hypothetical protein